MPKRTLIRNIECGILSTGNVAAMCGVSAPTAKRWIDTGRIASFSVPDSRERRVTAKDLMEFMMRMDFPIPIDLKDAYKNYVATYGK